jgi:hypothetical protein
MPIRAERVEGFGPQVADADQLGAWMLVIGGGM